MRGVTSGATMRTWASAANRLSIFPSATAPPPTTTTSRSRSFTKMGSKLMSPFDSERHRTGSSAPLAGGHKFSRQPTANLLVRLPRKKAPQILPGRSLLIECAEQPLDGVRNLRSRATITERPRDRSTLAHAPANAKVVRIYHASIHFQLLALDPNVRNPVLPATIRASGDVQLQLLLKARKPLIELFGEPAREAFRFRQRQLAEFRSGASHRAARKRRGPHRQTRRRQLASDARCMLIRNIHDQQVLHDRVAKMPVRVALGKIRRSAQLLRSDAPAQHVCADVRKPGLLLWMNANVVAVNIGGNFFRLGRIQREAEPLLQRRQERVRRPAMLQEKKFQPRALAVLAEHFGFPK